MIEILEKIEGEAKLEYSFKDGFIDFVSISFGFTRAIEQILQGKSVMDALVITPRVCGICGHAHLIATVRAIEACFDDLELTQKAKDVRELTLTLEVVLNHFKWFYLTLYPQLGFAQNIVAVNKISQQISKAIAIIAGQYPHNSYAIVGGVTGEITSSDRVELLRIVDAMIGMFENIIQTKKKEFWMCESIEELLECEGELQQALQKLESLNLHHSGKANDRFLVYGESGYFTRGKAHKTKILKNLDYRYVDTFFTKDTKAQNATYKDKYYEVGPLARAMVRKTPLIKDAHKRYGDASVSRIVAKMCEVAQLLNYCKKLIGGLDIEQDSYIPPKQKLSQLSGEGIGSVEAARGSLIHHIVVDEGKIKNYKMITPTQWNLANGDKAKLAPAQKAIVGLKTTQEAEIVLKIFDLCSVCTTK